MGRSIDLTDIEHLKRLKESCMSFDPGDRTYYVSDERLRAFRALPVEEKLRWVEELAMFIRLTWESDKPVSGVTPDKGLKLPDPLSSK